MHFVNGKNKIGFLQLFKRPEVVFTNIQRARWALELNISLQVVPIQKQLSDVISDTNAADSKTYFYMWAYPDNYLNDSSYKQYIINW